MSTELVVIGQDALAKGGLGMDSSVWQLRPAFLKLTQKLTRIPNAVPGKLLDTGTGIHMDDITIVLMAPPAQARKMYDPKSDFTRDSVMCFSLDMLRPDTRAKQPQAMVCSACPMGSWDKYRQTQEAKDKPPCRAYWRLFFVERATKMPYFLNVEGMSIPAFEEARQQFARTHALMVANTKQENLKILMENKAAQEQAVKEGKTEFVTKPLKPIPSIFDISFHIFVVPPLAGAKNQNYTLGFRDFRMLKPEDQAEFGSLFVQYANSKLQHLEAEEAAAAEAEEAAVITSTPAQPTQPVQGVVLPPTGGNAVSVGDPAAKSNIVI